MKTLTQLLLNTPINIKCTGQEYCIGWVQEAYKGDKMTEKIKTSRIVGMFMALCIAALFITSSAVVLAQQSESEPNDDFSEAG